MYENYFKRALDIAVSSLALFILSPFLLFVVVLLFYKDGKPIFFKQRRVGRCGNPFNIIKFRTMDVNNTSHHGSFDAGSVSRVTALGNFLRRYKIDELPQLFNVILGDMSIIGPRPEVEMWTQVYPEKWRLVLHTRPGITDWASIEFRNEEELLAVSKDPQETYRTEILPRKLQYYLDYVLAINFKNDVAIFFSTIMLLIRRKR